MVTSKHFCQQSTHHACAHDWSKELQYILELINDVTVEDPFSTSHPTIESVGVDFSDARDIIIAQLLEQLKLTQDTSESYWQQRLAQTFRQTDLKRETLGVRRFVTDFSNRSVLIELKNQKDVRTAIGQISEYRNIKKRAGHPVWFSYIMLFGDLQNWTPALWKERQALCAQHGIILRWLKL